jgi:hypothetical protein
VGAAKGFSAPRKFPTRPAPSGNKQKINLTE